jgi:hypothetical protein
LQALLKTNPQEVWAQLSPLLLSKDWLVRDRVKNLIEFERDDNLGPGLLFGLPENLYLDWTRRNPDDRATIVMDWLPIAVKANDGTLSWHPALEAFVREFGAKKGVLAGIGIRLHPRSWWGSVAPFLEPLIPLLESWDTHPLPEVRSWAEQSIVHLKKQIEEERRRDDDPTRFN